MEVRLKGRLFLPCSSSKEEGMEAQEVGLPFLGRSTGKGSLPA